MKFAPIFRLLTDVRRLFGMRNGTESEPKVCSMDSCGTALVTTVDIQTAIIT